MPYYVINYQFTSYYLFFYNAYIKLYCAIYKITTKNYTKKVFFFTNVIKNLIYNYNIII
ncbi:hypothetical protein FACI_IFERC00001G0953 [Ferroplasma acidarmanus Fer1]|jgi:hypothetical protein|uniref:Uncharacterized protein n=1 Tax=Ferroplasma acidarmanus Fer1 TaxID=333146 RepID=S0ANU3_FERAC|nr:hypothetical protein FACI_IFERC00001G0953 [Ferroplasma acidarmanus Fer1]